MPTKDTSAPVLTARFKGVLFGALLAFVLLLYVWPGVLTGGGPSPARTAARSQGIWISASELKALPMKGPAWQQVKATADAVLDPPNIADNDSNHDVQTLAVALVYGRTGQAGYRTKAVDAIMSAIGTDEGSNTLGVARNLVSYVIAADIVKLTTVEDERFRSWLRTVIDRPYAEGGTLGETHEWRANNWGTHAGASRAAVAVYLGDTKLLAQTARVFKGWLGDRSSWAGFNPEKDQSWQCDETQPVGVNRMGCLKEGHSIDGVLPYDQRRSGPFVWPPPQEPYVYGGLQGALAQAEILSRAGYPAWDWQDKALLRSFRWLHEQANYPAPKPSAWEPWLVNRRYGASFPAVLPAQHGKNMGWTDWMYGSR